MAGDEGKEKKGGRASADRLVAGVVSALGLAGGLAGGEELMDISNGMVHGRLAGMKEVREVAGTPLARLALTLADLPPNFGLPQVMTLPSFLSAANASLVEKMRVTPLDSPVTPVESPPELG